MSCLSTPVWGPLMDVYEPSEDSFFLLDTLETELDFILRSSPAIVLELGSGSGVIVTALAKALGSSVHSIAVDINPHACLASLDTALLNKTQVNVVCGDLANCLNLNHQVDLLVFNPPYVVTDNDEIHGTLTRAWAGGINGTQVLNRLLPDIPKILSPSGYGYFVLIEENYPEEIRSKLRSVGVHSKIIAKRKIPGEKLCILKFSRRPL